MEDDGEEMLLVNINHLKSILNEILSNKSLDNDEVIIISNLLDQFIVEYMRLINQDL